MSDHRGLSQSFRNYFRQRPGWLLDHEYQDEWSTNCHTSEGEEWGEPDGGRSRHRPQVSEPVDFNQEPLEHNVSNRQRKEIQKNKRVRAEEEERELRAENRPLPQRRRRRTSAKKGHRDDRHDVDQSGQDSGCRSEKPRADRQEAGSRRTSRDSSRQDPGRSGEARDPGRRDSRRRVVEVSPPRSPGPRQRPPAGTAREVVSRFSVESFLTRQEPEFDVILTSSDEKKKKNSSTANPGSNMITNVSQPISVCVSHSVHRNHYI